MAAAFVSGPSVGTGWCVSVSPSVCARPRVATARPRARRAALPRERLSMSTRVTAPATGPLRRLDAEDDTREAFGAAVRGEWPGFMADFNVDTGDALVIPNYYIPEEFVEWDMFPKGFESNNSVILRGSRLFQKRFRVLPNVNLFGDHVDVEEEMSIIDVSEEAGFYASACGTFSSGPAKVCVKRESRLEQWPKAELALRANQRAVRAFMTFDFEKAELLEPLSVTLEKWDCIYCDGGNIDGSSGYVEGWTSESAMAPSDLAGIWKSSDPETPRVERTDGGPPPEPRKQLYLPEGIDLGIRKLDDGGISLHVGRLVDGHTRYILTRRYVPDGTVASSHFHTEKKQE